jgi:hypothetical protein
MVEEAQANARGDRAASIEAGNKRKAQEQGNLYLVGDDNVAIAYRELLVHLTDRLGRGLAIDDLVSSFETMSLVSAALSDQEDRARAGKPLRSCLRQPERSSGARGLSPTESWASTSHRQSAAGWHGS